MTSNPSPTPANGTRPLVQGSSLTYEPPTSPTPAGPTSSKHRDKIQGGPHLEKVPITKKQIAQSNEAYKTGPRRPSHIVPIDHLGTSRKRSKPPSSSDSEVEENRGNDQPPIITTAASLLQDANRREDVFLVPNHRNHPPPGNPPPPTAPEMPQTQPGGIEPESQPDNPEERNQPRDDDLQSQPDETARQSQPDDVDQEMDMADEETAAEQLFSNERSPSQMSTSQRSRSPPLPPNTQASKPGELPTQLSNVASRLRMKKEKAPKENSSTVDGRESIHSPKPPGGYAQRHGHDSLWLYNNVSSDIVDRWMHIDGYKLLVQPFSTTSHNRNFASATANEIIRVIEEIYDVTEVCCTPAPAATRPRGPNGPPYTFCVYSIDQPTHDKLLEQDVINTKDITFAVYSFVQPPPSYLGYIDKLNNIGTPKALESATQCIKNTFDKKDVYDYLYDLYKCDSTEGNDIDPLVHYQVRAIIDTLRVDRLDVCLTGGKKAPVLSLFIDVDFNSEQEWFDLVRAVKRSSFETGLHGNGIFGEGWKCTQCHSIEHPSGMCPFDKVPGWIPRQILPPSPEKKGKNRYRGGNRQHKDDPEPSHSENYRGGKRGAPRGRGGRGRY